MMEFEKQAEQVNKESDEARKCDKNDEKKKVKVHHMGSGPWAINMAHGDASEAKEQGHDAQRAQQIRANHVAMLQVGENEVDEDVWNELQHHPHIKAAIESKKLFVGDGKDCPGDVKACEQKAAAQHVQTTANVKAPQEGDFPELEKSAEQKREDAGDKKKK